MLEREIPATTAGPTAVEELGGRMVDPGLWSELKRWRGPRRSSTTDEEIDVDALVAASERFTPADVEFAANKAAQFAFEREHAGERTTRATTEIFLEVIAESRPTLTEETIETFADDRSRYARYRSRRRSAIPVSSSSTTRFASAAVMSIGWS